MDITLPLLVSFGLILTVVVIYRRYSGEASINRLLQRLQYRLRSQNGQHVQQHAPVVNPPATPNRVQGPQINRTLALWLAAGAILIIATVAIVMDWMLVTEMWMYLGILIFLTASGIGGWHVWKEGAAQYTKVAFYSLVTVTLVATLIILLIGTENVDLFFAIVKDESTAYMQDVLSMPKGSWSKHFTGQNLLLLMASILIGYAILCGGERK